VAGPAPLASTADWRNLFAAAIYTGMRKGELLGLRRLDVDLAADVLTVARSYDREIVVEDLDGELAPDDMHSFWRSRFYDRVRFDAWIRGARSDA
jgi:integrase